MHSQRSIEAITNSGTAVFARSESGDGVNGTSSSGIGVHASSPSNTGVYAFGATKGVYGVSLQGIGVYGTITSSYGVYGQSNTSYGVYGTSTSNVGILGASTDGVGVYAYSANSTGIVSRGQVADFDAQGPGVDYAATSSRRWKHNILNISDPLAKIERLRGVYFDWDEKHGGRHDVGFVAEEIGEVLPEIVIYEANGIDATGMDYSKMTPLLVEADNAMRKEYQQKLFPPKFFQVH